MHFRITRMLVKFKKKLDVNVCLYVHPVLPGAQLSNRFLFPMTKCPSTIYSAPVSKVNGAEGDQQLPADPALSTEISVQIHVELRGNSGAQEAYFFTYNTL